MMMTTTLISIVLTLLLVHDGTALPDLVADAVYLSDTLRVETLPLYDPCLLNSSCVPSLGEHRLLRFGIRIHNVAHGPDSNLVVGAPNASDPEQWFWHGCHSHWHASDYVHANLFFHDNLTLAVASVKYSFCLRDTACTRPGASPSFGQLCDFQGITAGCYDEYDVDTACQWIVIDNLPNAARYTLQIIVDPLDHYAEQNEGNNRAEITFVLQDIVNGCASLLWNPHLFVLFAVLWYL